MEQTYTGKAIKEHFSNTTLDDFYMLIEGLGSEGKNIINILNQMKLSKEFNGKFVGFIENGHDIVANGLKLELKCNVNQATDLGKTVGFASFLQKKNWDYLIHYTPKAFNTYLNEDKFVVFSKSDLPQIEKYCNDSGSIRWTHKLFNEGYKFNNSGGRMEKLRFIKSKIMNFDGLYNLIWHK